MNYIIDGIIILCLAWGAYRGFKKGFIIQSFTIIALVLAIWGGFAFAGTIEPFLQKNFKIDELVSSIISFIIVFLMVLILVYISGYLVSKIAEAATLGMINRLAGAAFGIFANVLILSVLIMLFNRVNDNRKINKEPFIEPKTLNDSYLYEPVGKVAPAIFPESFFKKLQNL